MKRRVSVCLLSSLRRLQCGRRQLIEGGHVPRYLTQSTFNIAALMSTKTDRHPTSHEIKERAKLSVVCDAYLKLCDEENGQLHFDSQQFQVLKLLSHIEENMKLLTQSKQDRLSQQLILQQSAQHSHESDSNSPSPTATIPPSNIPSSSSGQATTTTMAAIQPSGVKRARGLYLYGNVGTGKTIVMDLFHQHSTIPKKKRIHFHKFMLDLHHRIRQEKLLFAQEMKEAEIAEAQIQPVRLQQQPKTLHQNNAKKPILSEREAIKRIATKIATQEAQLLCLDEFQVLDIYDAMTLTSLLSELWQLGVVLVTTSNRAPKDLYENGLQREYVISYLITAIQKNCVIKSFDKEIDYRRQLSALSPVSLQSSAAALSEVSTRVFYSPSTPQANDQLTRDCQQMSHWMGGKAGSAASEEDSRLQLFKKTVSISFNRSLSVSCFQPTTNSSSNSSSNSDDGHTEGVCLTDFEYLCDGDRGSVDYQTLCRSFDAIYLTNVPILSSRSHNQARRFILLIDEIYDSKCLLRWCSDAASIDGIFSDKVPQRKGMDGDDEEVGGEQYASIAKQQHDEQLQRKIDHKLEGNIRGYSVLNHSKSIAISPNTQLQAQTVPTAHVKEESLNVIQSELASVLELKFAFERTKSRLIEISSKEYYRDWLQRIADKHKTNALSRSI